MVALELVSFETRDGRIVQFYRRKRGSIEKLPPKLKKWAKATKAWHKQNPNQPAISKRGSKRHHEISQLAKKSK